MKIIIGRGTVSPHILDHFSEDGVPVGLCGEDGKRSICPVHFHGDVAKTDTICPMCRDIYLKGGKDGTIPE